MIDSWLVCCLLGPGGDYLLTVRTDAPLPDSPLRIAWVQRQCLAMFVACLRCAVAGGEDLDNLAYPEFLGIDQQQAGYLIATLLLFGCLLFDWLLLT